MLIQYNSEDNNSNKSIKKHPYQYKHQLRKGSTIMTSTTTPSSFAIQLSYKGKTVTVDNVTMDMTCTELYDKAFDVLDLNKSVTELKILYKGKKLNRKNANSGQDDDDGDNKVFSSSSSSSSTMKLPMKKPPKFIVMATSSQIANEIAAKRSDPTIRGLDDEKRLQEEQQQQRRHNNQSLHWGKELSYQSKDYKFCRLEACTWQSFGHRPSDRTPHDYEAKRLLEKMVTDPGIVAIMKERELVVGTLGEMDPIDDRIMLAKQSERDGSCLLGYNTNGGLRIDIKLRTDDLQGFRPYHELISTLIHELSHNWVSDHNLLFWTNYAQMRAEYLYTHAKLRSTIVNGKTTAELAGLVFNSSGGANNNNNNINSSNKSSLDVQNIVTLILNELVHEMRQHQLHPRMIEGPIRQRCEELELAYQKGQRLGGDGMTGTVAAAAAAAANNGNSNPSSARERALEAAEKRRAKEQHQQQNEQSKGKGQ